MSAQSDRSRRAVGAQPGEGIIDQLCSRRRGGRDDQVQSPDHGVPVFMVLEVAVHAGQLGNHRVQADVLAAPPALLRPVSHTCLQLRPRTASSSSASFGPWLPAS